MSQVFGADYADTYDTLYQDKDYDGECRLLDRMLQENARQPIRRILDLGCGTGSHAVRLGGAYQVVGVDRSADMLRQATRKAKDQGVAVEFHESSIADLNLSQKFDAALMMFAVLGYHIENTEVLGALRAARRHLSEGGLLLFDVWYGPAVLTQRPGDRVRVIESDRRKVLRTASSQLDTLKHTCLVQFRVWEITDGHLSKETVEGHPMRYFFPQELKLFLATTGFELVRLVPFPETDRTVDESTWNIMVVARAC